MEPQPSSPSESMQSLPVSIASDIEKNEKFKITLDSPNNTYYSGQTIRGTIEVTNKQAKKIRGIYFRIVGYGKCSWTDILRRDTINDNSKSERTPIQQHSGNEKYLNSTVYVIGSKNGTSFCLSEGTSTYDISFQLKRQLPSSFAGAYGKIKYKMEFVIDKPWKFDEKQQLVLTVIQLVDMQTVPGVLSPREEQTSRNFGYIGSGPITLQVLVPKCYYVPSETLSIQVICTNHSRINVDKMKFTLHKIVTYHSSLPNRVRKQDVQKILKKEAGGVAKKTEQRYQHEIDIPAATPSQSDGVSQLIHIQYELRVEAKVSGLYKNLVLSVPLTIGNVPACGSLALPLPATTTPVAVPYGPPYPLGSPPYPLRAPSYPLRSPSYPLRANDDSPPSISIGLNFNRLSITSSSGFRLISSTSPGSNRSVSQADRMSISHSTDTDSIISTSPSSSLSRASNSFSSHRSSSMTSSAIADASVSSISSSHFPPSAPPLDPNATNVSRTSTSTHHATCIDAPPSYDEVFGTASTSQSYTEVHSSSPISPNARKT